MPECQFINICPIFKKSAEGLLKSVYSVFYCKGDFMEDCKRRKLMLYGEDVPENLLPDGNKIK